MDVCFIQSNGSRSWLFLSRRYFSGKFTYKNNYICISTEVLVPTTKYYKFADQHTASAVNYFRPPMHARTIHNRPQSRAVRHRYGMKRTRHCITRDRPPKLQTKRRHEYNDPQSCNYRPGNINHVQHAGGHKNAGVRRPRLGGLQQRPLHFTVTWYDIFRRQSTKNVCLLYNSYVHINSVTFLLPRCPKKISPRDKVIWLTAH